MKVTKVLWLNNFDTSRTRAALQLMPVSQEWETAIAEWCAWLTLSGKSPSTIRVRRDHVRLTAKATASTAPRALTKGVLIRWCAGQNWSPAYRQSLRTSLVTFYAWAINEGHAETNLGETLPAVRSSAPAPRPVTDKIWHELLTTAPERERLMIRLAGEAGLRRSEVAGLHRDDLRHDQHGWSLIVRGKGSKQRVVPITKSLAAAICSHCAAGFVFPGQCDGHMAAQHVGVLVSRLMPAGWSMHKLRHRFATRGYSGTGNLRATQEVLGHASVATTQRYTAVSPRDVRSVVDAAGYEDDPAA